MHCDESVETWQDQNERLECLLCSASEQSSQNERKYETMLTAFLLFSAATVVVLSDSDVESAMHEVTTTKVCYRFTV
ncbi:unnamed protein product [Gongylonema pulchrum]|uniref:Uncharacterized protein n=1 Tax=Gongylonema pulchrum TaxID=637853 RepID=A0A183DMZ6_9BILA|nr:unnamed protein product [Gongylonema pulchrum]